jgi:hypothetical protein
LTFKLVSFSTSSLNTLKHLKASDFFLRNQTQVILVYSSMSCMKYCSPYSHFVLLGPHKLVCTISNGFFCRVFLFLEFNFCLFSIMTVLAHGIHWICNFWNLSYNLLLANIDNIIKVYMDHYPMPNPTFIFFSQTTSLFFNLIQDVYVVWSPCRYCH